MLDLQACTVCFSTDVKLFNMNDNKLRHNFNIVSGLRTHQGNGMPDYLCVECSTLVGRFIKFRHKCQRAHLALQEIINRNKQITIPNLEAFNVKEIDIAPTLAYIDLNRTHYEKVKFQWVKHNRLGVLPIDKIPIAHYSTLTKEETFELPSCTVQNEHNENIKIENDGVNIDIPKLNNDEDKQMLEDIEDTQIHDDFDNDHFESDIEATHENIPHVSCKDGKQGKSEEADGSNLDEEYANIYPISLKEAQAVAEVYKMFSQGNRYNCDVCGKSYCNEKRLKIHSRMHDKYISGTYYCELCKYYYKTQFLLKTHMTEKHMYKYVCRKCPEVSYDRISAKQHFIWTHLQKGSKKDANWYESRPTWLSSRGGKRTKGVVSIRPVKKITKLPPDFPKYTPITQEEQYKLILERKESRNYIESQYKCDLCYKGFRGLDTYNKHMKKHDPAYSGKLQCDMCKLYFRDGRKMYKHMNITHRFKYSCQFCACICYSRNQAQMHYRFHKNITYKCPHCDKEFKKISTRLTHIRIKHPSTNICNLCGHSYVSEMGLYCHKQIAHSKEEVELSAATLVDPSHPYYCSDCNIHFLNEAAFNTHHGSSNKHAVTNLTAACRRPGEVVRWSSSTARPDRQENEGIRKRGRPRRAGSSDIINNGVPTSTCCELCGKFLVNDVQTRKHYETEHPGADYLKRYMCDVCGHTTKQYANLMVHMRTHTNEKPYGCPHCDRRFSMMSNRDRHLVVHTGEKRYQCQHCNRRFTQSSAVKLHIQTVHLKIPYAPWDKKNRKRRKELEGTSAPVSAVNAVTAACLQPTHPHKLLIEAQGDYLNAYITYNDD